VRVAEPPVIATLLAFCVAIVPRPKSVCAVAAVLAPVPPDVKGSGVAKVSDAAEIAPVVARSPALSILRAFEVPTYKAL
jgi:hypothetical protein